MFVRCAIALLACLSAVVPVAAAQFTLNGIIPAYRSRYFRDALQSAVSQTHNYFEIVICDDSADNSIHDVVKELSVENPDVKIAYQKNERREGNLGNFLECLSLAKGNYIKFLNDDDLITPQCIEKMSAVLLENPQVSLVFSPRDCINEHGEKIGDIEATKPIYKGDCEVEGLRLATVMLYLLTNIVGEPTTVMFRHSDVSNIRPHLATFAGRLPVGVGDVAIWLNLLSKGNAYYFHEPLSSFRLHNEQRQNQPHIQETASDSWIYLLKHARRLGLLQKLKFWQLLIRNNTDNKWKKIYLIRPRILARQTKNVVKKVFKECKKGNLIALLRDLKTLF